MRIPASAGLGQQFLSLRGSKPSSPTLLAITWHSKCRDVHGWKKSAMALFFSVSTEIYAKGQTRT